MSAAIAASHGLDPASTAATADHDDDDDDDDEQIDESSSVRIIHLSSSQSSQQQRSQRPQRPQQHHRHLKTRTNQNSNELAQILTKSSSKISTNSINNIQAIAVETTSQSLKSVCYHDGKLRLFNSTWSPLKCTQCRCALNSVVDCYVLECPQLNCTTVRESFIVVYVRTIIKSSLRSNFLFIKTV